MFKGLRTKIEDEQKGLVPSHSSNSDNRSTLVDCAPYDSTLTSPIDNVHKTILDQTNPQIIRDFDATSESSNKISPSKEDNVSTVPIDESIVNPAENHELELRNLKHRLDSATRDREESNEQNAELYRIIDNLKRDLENERELNSTLQNKLTEAVTNQGPPSTNQSSTSKSLDPEFSTNEIKESDDSQLLRKKIQQLENEVKEKNRQLKIRQQNLNDIKKALQKEFMDHNSTRIELVKLQDQIKQASQNLAGPIDCANQQNGSSLKDYTEANSKGFTVGSSDKNQDPSNYMPSDGIDRFNNNSPNMTNQLDRISYVSHSSASVDEFESDVNNQTDYSKEVNHEYLRNVLFRYMTTTDNATARHLVKALSVLMNFTPEQYNSINKAMNARSSWLRLK